LLHTPTTIMFCAQMHGPSIHGLSPLKLWAKVSLSFLKLFLSGIWPQWHRRN
jgi:hypothetical protein